RSLRTAAGLPGLRFYDLRHHAITELAESQASEQTIMAIAGHISAKIIGHYSHVRWKAKRKAVDALAGPQLESDAGDGYDTNHATNQVEPDAPLLQVVDLFGG